LLIFIEINNPFVIQGLIFFFCFLVNFTFGACLSISDLMIWNTSEQFIEVYVIDGIKIQKVVVRLIIDIFNKRLMIKLIHVSFVNKFLTVA